MLSDNFYYTEINGVGHMACSIQGEAHLDEPALNYMLYNEKEFTKFNVNKSDGCMVFLYQIPEYITIYEYMTNKLSKNQMMELINEICMFAISLMENKVNIPYVVWDWNYIYINPSQKRLYFMLVPSRLVVGNDEEVINLLRFITAYARYDLVENCHYVAIIISMLNSGKSVQDTLKEVTKIIKKLSVETVMRTKKESVKTIDVSSSEKLSSVDIAKKSWGNLLGESRKDSGSEHPPVPCLVRLKTKETIQIYKDRFVIGKEPDSVDYIVSDNPAVSRVHAIIEKKNGALYIRDNKSSNKTFVNGKPISESEQVLLINGMVISVANEEFIYKIV